MIAAIIRFMRLTRLHLLQIEADGYAVAGNRLAELECCGRIALLKATLAPLGDMNNCRAPEATVGNGATASDSPSYTPYRDRDSSAKKAPPLRVGAQGGGAWRFMDDYEKVEAGAYLEHVGGYKP